MKCQERVLEVSLGGYQGAPGALGGVCSSFGVLSGGLCGLRWIFLECLGEFRVGRGEHWGGFGDSADCLGALKDSHREHLEQFWGVYSKSWEALVKLKVAFCLSHWLKCLRFIVCYKNAPHPSGKHDLFNRSAHSAGPGRGKREEERGKREEGREKREEGIWKREEGRGTREDGRGKRERGNGGRGK